MTRMFFPALGGWMRYTVFISGVRNGLLLNGGLAGIGAHLLERLITPRAP